MLAILDIMQKVSLEALVREQLKRAREAAHGRSAETVYGGHEHRLRQTLIALVSEASLAEHESPGEATLIVLTGRVRLSTHDTEWEACVGDLLVVPQARHSLLALEDSAVVLTVVKGT